jgi:plastocyanin
MRVRFSFIAVPAVLFAVACGGGGDSSTGTTPTGPTTPTVPQTPSTPASPVLTNAVSVDNDFFSPANIQVTPGTTVTWSWVSGATTHNVSFTDGAGGSGDKASGSFSRTFSAAGTFDYRCTLHGGMNGTVLVKS